jgi:peptidyl-prolyl cis-trans isomerase A (cyclophilin A)
VRRSALAFALLALVLAAPARSEPNPHVTLSTSKGDIEIELFVEQAPATVANFLTYLDAGFYDGTIFHRVIPDYVIQGGGFTADMNRKTTRAPIVNEADNGLPNARGSVATARTPAVDSATAQFFINLKDNAPLNHGARDFGYAVFGRVTRGMEVVEAIAAVPTALKKGHRHVPTRTVKITGAARSAPQAAEPDAEP